MHKRLVGKREAFLIRIYFRIDRVHGRLNSVFGPNIGEPNDSQSRQYQKRPSDGAELFYFGVIGFVISYARPFFDRDEKDHR